MRYALLFQSTLTIGSASNQSSRKWTMEIDELCGNFVIYSVCGYQPFRLSASDLKATAQRVRQLPTDRAD